VPENLSFLKEPLVITSVVMIIIYVFLALMAGPAVLEEFAEGGNYIMYAIMQGLTFGAAIGIIIYGVRMILAELVPAFQGIAQSLIPTRYLHLTVHGISLCSECCSYWVHIQCHRWNCGYVFGGPLGTSIDYPRHDSTLF